MANMPHAISTLDFLINIIWEEWRRLPPPFPGKVYYVGRIIDVSL
jgi:hypothetical protein